MEWPRRESDCLRAVLDAMPSLVFVVDREARVLDGNRAAERACDATAETMLRRLSGEVLHCLNAARSSEGCGKTEFCPDCAIRKGVQLAARGETGFRRRQRMVLQRGDYPQEVQFYVTVAPFRHGGEELYLLILDDLAELVDPSRTIPICVSCKSVRGDDQSWSPVERYLKEHTELDPSQTICPDCARKARADLG